MKFRGGAHGAPALADLAAAIESLDPLNSHPAANLAELITETLARVPHLIGRPVWR
jgi:hypothetical protein